MFSRIFSPFLHIKEIVRPNPCQVTHRLVIREVTEQEAAKLGHIGAHKKGFLSEAETSRQVSSPVHELRLKLVKFRIGPPGWLRCVEVLHKSGKNISQVK